MFLKIINLPFEIRMASQVDKIASCHQSVVSKIDPKSWNIFCGQFFVCFVSFKVKPIFHSLEDRMKKGRKTYF